jgi:LCP family protein required for cell wall assembly
MAQVQQTPGRPRGPRPPTSALRSPAPRRAVRRPSSRRSRLQRLWRRAAVTLSLLVLVVSLGGYTALTYFDGRIGRIHLWFTGSRPAERAGVTNWLLVGTDSRDGTGREYNNTGRASGDNNSDTQILAHVSADGTTTLVSFPRDTYVPIPGYTDAHGVAHPSHQDKMNSALPAGGPSLLVQTVEALTGLRVDHYGSVNLAGFKAMTDALGGADVCVTDSRYVETGVDDTGRPYRATNLDDPFSQFHATPGRVHLDGEQALAFVRQRHGFPDGDLSRIRRQHAFLGAIARSLSGSRLVSDPLALERLLNAATGALTVDDHTSLTDLRQLAERLRGLDPGKVRFETIPTHAPRPGEQGADQHGLIDGRSVLVYDPQQLADFLSPLVDDGRPPPPAPSRPATTTALSNPPVSPTARPPTAVAVRVDNGSAINGAARRAAQALTGRGFKISSWAPLPSAATRWCDTGLDTKMPPLPSRPRFPTPPPKPTPDLDLPWSSCWELTDAASPAPGRPQPRRTPRRRPQPLDLPPPPRPTPPTAAPTNDRRQQAGRPADPARTATHATRPTKDQCARVAANVWPRVNFDAQAA